MLVRIRTKTGAQRKRAGRMWTGDWQVVDDAELSREQRQAIAADASLDVRPVEAPDQKEPFASVDALKAEVARLTSVNRRAEVELAQVRASLKMSDEAAEAAVKRALDGAAQAHAEEISALKAVHASELDALSKAHTTKAETPAAKAAEAKPEALKAETHPSAKTEDKHKK